MEGTQDSKTRIKYNDKVASFKTTYQQTREINLRIKKKQNKSI